jgi:hypothetical protein
MAKTIDEILQKYYDEANGGMVQKAPSTLNRGEGTEKEYFIYKIDLVGSTIFTWSRSHQTYLKFAHTFLSTVDEITRHYGADDNQVEYAGDSVIAYFPKSVGAINVLVAAYVCRDATLRMKSLDATLKKFPYHTKTVVHFGKLIMAKIGPHGDSMVSAIGPELHKACKMEKNVSAGEGRASKEFMGQLEGRQRILLKANYKEIQVLKQPESNPISGGLLAEAFSQSLSPRHLLGTTPNNLSPFEVQKGIAMPLNFLSALAPPVQPSNQALQYETKRELVDYSIRWDMFPSYFSPRQ